ncbi:hypothetical protein LCGC14_2991130, partial [marine sediment metagenome]
MADDATDTGTTGEIEAGTTPTSSADDSTQDGSTPADATVSAQSGGSQAASDDDLRIPKYRLDEATARGNRFETQVQDLITQNERNERRIRAVMGVDDPEGAGIEKPEVVQLRKDLESVYPELAWLRGNFEA